MGATKITEKVTIEGEGSNIVFDGVDFTLNGYVDVKKANSVVFKNCRVYGLTTEEAKKFWLTAEGDLGLKLRLENCMFGTNGEHMYNILEPNAKLSDGSGVKNCYFKAMSGSHNAINVYGAQNNADIDIVGNVFESFTPGIRVGVKGDVPCTLTVKDNVILAYDPTRDGADTKWLGLMCVQPYGTQTTSFANMTIIASGNSVPAKCPHLVYGYCGKTDTKLTAENSPKLTIDGVEVEMPIIDESNGDYD